MANGKAGERGGLGQAHIAGQVKDFCFYLKSRSRKKVMKADLLFKMSPLQLYCGHVRECPKHTPKSLEVMGHAIRNLLLNSFEKNVHVYVHEREKEWASPGIRKSGKMQTIGVSDKTYT